MKSKITISISVLLLFAIIQVKSQNNVLETVSFSEKDSLKQSHRLALFLEYGNKSLNFAFNGEYEIAEICNFKLNSSLGFFYLPAESIHRLSVPFGFNIITKKGKHHLEIGLGANYSKVSAKNILIDSEGVPIPNSTFYQDLTNGVFIIPSIGYRYDKLKSGFIFKINYSPVFNVFNFIEGQNLASNNWYLAGISIGYRL